MTRFPSLLSPPRTAFRAAVEAEVRRRVAARGPVWDAEAGPPYAVKQSLPAPARSRYAAASIPTATGQTTSRAS